MPHRHKRKHTHSMSSTMDFCERKKERERRKKTTPKNERKKLEFQFFFHDFMSLYYAVGQKLICPIGKFLLHTMQINISFKLLDRHSYILLHLNLEMLYIFFCRWFSTINKHTYNEKM